MQLMLVVVQKRVQARCIMSKRERQRERKRERVIEVV